MRIVGRLTHSPPLVRLFNPPVHVARLPPARFFEPRKHSGRTQTPYSRSLSDCGRFLPLASAEIIQSRAASAAFFFHFHFCDAWRMKGKYSLDALAVRDTAHGESFVEPATLPSDHYPRKDLNSFFISFHHASVHAHTIANRKRFGIAFLLFFLNRTDDLIHKLVASRAAAGAHSHSKARVLQPEIANHLGTSTKQEQGQDNIRKSVKISRMCG